MARAPLPRPAPAAGSPENFSLATFQVTHMNVCRSASSSRSWCSQRNLWRKSFQGSHRRARTRAPWLFLVGPARADGSPENFSLATFQVTHMYVCRSASSSRSWCFERKLRGKSFQQSHRRARAGRRWEGSRTGVQVAGSLYLQSDTPALKILESEIAVGKAICPHPSMAYATSV